MKQRTYRALNVFALCLLLFAGYLNFIKRDKDAAGQSYKTKEAHVSKGTVLVSNPEQYQKNNTKSGVQHPELQN